MVSFSQPLLWSSHHPTHLAMSLRSYTNLSTQDLEVITFIVQEKAKLTTEHEAAMSALKKQHALELAAKCTTEAVTKLAAKNARLVTKLEAKDGEVSRLSECLQSIANQINDVLEETSLDQDDDWDDDLVHDEEQAKPQPQVQAKVYVPKHDC